MEVSMKNSADKKMFEKSENYQQQGRKRVTLKAVYSYNIR